MDARAQLKAFYLLFSILMLYVAFFTAYFVVGMELVMSFVRGIMAFVVTNLVLRLAYFMWRHSFSARDWRLIIDGHLPLDDEDEDV